MLRVSDALRLAQATDPVDNRAGANVENVHRIVAELRDHETLASGVIGHVVDPTAYVMQRDGPLQHKWRVSRRVDWALPGTECGQCGYRDDAKETPFHG